ncbi:MAG: GNAT family N-acetyltransferase, partial [Acidobacteria bacterium]|nr:GNAT family N-acetyltransferase [Acidobacteriota bacterium]
PLRLGSRVDAQFGPVLQLGAGGALRPFLPGDALALPPLNSTLSRLMVERSVVRGGLQRGGFSLEALERALLQLSLLVSENRRIAAIELDPAWVSGEAVGVGKARIELHGFATPDAALPRLAIRPYPERYVRASVLKNGEAVVIRPIRAEDEPAMVEFHKGLSERSVYFRYFQILNLTQRTAHERLTRICFIDYAREMALVAEREHGEILGVGRLSRLHGSNDAEFAVLVADSSQGQGLGLELLRRLIEVAREEGIAYLAGQIHPENRGMIALARKAGFRIRDLIDEGVVESYLNL